MGEIKDGALVVTGSYSYIGPDGVTYKVDYVADKVGFKPHGDHIQEVSTVPVPIVNIEPIEFVPINLVTTELPPPVALPPAAINSLLGK